jgi:TRAP transporter TAXI family solute receptor
MKMKQKSSRKSSERLKIYLPSLIVTLIGFVIAFQFIKPAPPKTITIATGDPKGAYYAFGQRYREILAKYGITLNVRSTKGSVENLDLLGKPAGGVDVAFIQGGVGDPASMPELGSLASLYFEPLWVFHRAEMPVNRLTDFRGKRIAVGQEGSGTRALALLLLKENGIDEGNTSLLSWDGQQAEASLRSGKADAAFFVASPRSSFVSNLLAAEGLSLLSMERAEAYTRVHRFLNQVTLPEGVADFRENIPRRDVHLLAASATLVVREDFHPALVDLVLQAASEVHGSGGIFDSSYQFPSPEFVDFPIRKEALRYFKSGPPFLQKYLPFWAASLIDRLKVMLLPFLTLLIPLFKVVPPTYRWRVRSRITHWYKELQAMDLMVMDNKDPEKFEGYLAQLEQIDREVARVTVPPSYASELYTLRVHIAHIRKMMGKDHPPSAPVKPRS